MMNNWIKVFMLFLFMGSLALALCLGLGAIILWVVQSWPR